MMHITISKDGETLYDIDTCAAFVCAIADDDVLASYFLEGTGMDTAKLLWAVDHTRESLLSHNPVLKYGYPLIKDEIRPAFTVDLGALRQQMEGGEEE